MVDTALTPAAERPVFVATDDRRARRLRYLAAFAVALAGAWIVALAIGMLGIGQLPGLSLPVVVRGAEKPVEGAAPQSANPVAPLAQTRTHRAPAIGSSPSRAVSAASPSAAVIAPAATTTARRSRPPARSRTVSPARRYPATPTPAGAPSTTARQGWARRGLSTPPGRARAAEPRTKAAASPGHTRQQDTETTTAPAAPVATPVPPGQQKKPDDAKQTG